MVRLSRPKDILVTAAHLDPSDEELGTFADIEVVVDGNNIYAGYNGPMKLHRGWKEPELNPQYLEWKERKTSQLKKLEARAQQATDARQSVREFKLFSFGKTHTDEWCAANERYNDAWDAVHQVQKDLDFIERNEWIEYVSEGRKFTLHKWKGNYRPKDPSKPNYLSIDGFYVCMLMNVRMGEANVRGFVTPGGIDVKRSVIELSNLTSDKIRDLSRRGELDESKIMRAIPDAYPLASDLLLLLLQGRSKDLDAIKDDLDRNHPEINHKWQFDLPLQLKLPDDLTFETLIKLK